MGKYPSPKKSNAPGTSAIKYNEINHGHRRKKDQQETERDTVEKNRTGYQPAKLHTIDNGQHNISISTSSVLNVKRDGKQYLETSPGRRL
jgi:hypothetical protein